MSKLKKGSTKKIKTVPKAKNEHKKIVNIINKALDENVTVRT
jgi:hypothetical protein